MSFATYYFPSQPCIRITKREYAPPQAPPLVRVCGPHWRHRYVPYSLFSSLNSYPPHSLKHDNPTRALGHAPAASSRATPFALTRRQTHEQTLHTLVLSHHPCIRSSRLPLRNGIPIHSLMHRPLRAYWNLSVFKHNHKK